MTKKPANFSEKHEKRSVTVNGRKTSITLRPSIWSAFVKLTKKNGTNAGKVMSSWMLNDVSAIVPAIEAYVLANNDGPVYSYATREQWLMRVVDAMRPIFEERGYKLPEKIRVSVGFPSTGYRSKAIGECWPTRCSADKYNQIFVTPTLTTERALASLLTHELCHAWDDCKSGHKAPFKKCGTAMGLIGKPTHMSGGPEWDAWALPILEQVGKIPHGAIEAYTPKKKQTTRMLKCECPACGFTFRTSAKWMEGKEYLTCPDPDCQETIHIDQEGEGEGE